MQQQFLEPGYAQPPYQEPGYARPPQQPSQQQPHQPPHQPSHQPPHQPPQQHPPQPRHQQPGEAPPRPEPGQQRPPRHAQPPRQPAQQPPQHPLQQPPPRHAQPPQQPLQPPPPRPPRPAPGYAQAPPRQQPPPGRWDRIVLGRAAAVPEPKPPPADPYRPDTVFDGWSTRYLTVRLASVRGDEHRCSGRPRQDDITVAWHEATEAVVFAVADGVSAAPQSHIGAALACRTAVNDLLGQLDEERKEPDWTRVVQAAAYQLLMRVARVGEPSEEHLREAIATLATTLVAGRVLPLADGTLRVDLVQVGDTAAWQLVEGLYHPLLGVESDDEISSSAVLALPRLPSALRPRSYQLPADGVLLVGTDGFGVPLGDGAGMVGELMAAGLSHPPREPRTLAHLLDFSRETFDDDRTLLAVWPRHRLTEGMP
ncbi:protein phosphatase 2C domain-containing protein [Streptomyces maoxianensis]|uniref:Protein phosphatase 2C domain-containing protein n=1 Tax=Streptomyces maoxianensis TaxID=1459942 RepID=A0ABV9G766_9ACTN